MTNLYNKLYFCELVENPHAGETKPSEDITEIEVVWTGASETQKKTNLLDRHERNGGSHAGSCNHLPHNVAR